jgi:hypothetical protein
MKEDLAVAVSVVGKNIILFDGVFAQFNVIRNNPELFADTITLARFVISKAIDDMYEENCMQYQGNIAKGLNVSEIQRGSVFVARLAVNDGTVLSEKGLESRRSKPYDRGVYEEKHELKPRFHPLWFAVANTGFIPEAISVLGDVENMNGICLAIRDTPRKRL